MGLFVVIVLKHILLNGLGVNMKDIDFNGNKKIKIKANYVGSSKSSDSVQADCDIVREEVKFNSQNGEGHYREVTYSDGGFRQFDVDSGKLIGSSYESDQINLPNLE